MGFLYYAITFMLFIAIIQIFAWLYAWGKGGYQDISEWLRWVIFLPISIIGAGVLSIALLINTHYLFPLKEEVGLCISWVIIPMILFYAVSITIPRGKKIMPMILCAIWVALSIFSVINNDPNQIIRVIQIITMSCFLFLWAKTPTKDFYK